ncbi:uncharacterized protein METZ01_LOCUS435179, partial [marine metagenome]
MSSISLLSKNLPPLAERVRPQILPDFIGQTELLHENSLLTRAVVIDQPFSLIFWGPPGTGKTTLARILANEFNSDFFELSAILNGVKDVREVLKKGTSNFKDGKRSILFIDEIHRFTKSQQDALLHSVEEGSIILIGATTENPSFEVISPLLSRCRVFRLHPLNEENLIQILKRAINEDIILSQRNLAIDSDVQSLILNSCGGDARKMLNTLELAVSLHSEKNAKLLQDDIEEALQQKNIIYDKTGDYHYDVISAFIKSIR